MAGGAGRLLIPVVLAHARPEPSLVWGPPVDTVLRPASTDSLKDVWLACAASLQAPWPTIVLDMLRAQRVQ